MKKVMPILIALIIILTAANIYAAAKDSFKPQVGKYGGELVLSTFTDPKSFNAIIAKETSTTEITGYMFEGLTRINGITTEVEPNLAKSWELDKSGLTWTFHLRDDVKWFDGEPFTAQDVVFTFTKLIYNEKIPNSARDIFTIEGKEIRVEAPDKFTVRFTLPVKFAPFLQSMTQEILPEHVLSRSVKEDKFNSTWGVNTPPGQIIGTGPFMLEKYLPGQRIILKRNPNYWRKDKAGNRLPYLDRIIYLVVQSQDVGLLKFQQGELDYYGLRGSDYPILKPKEKSANYTVFETGPTFGTDFLVFNLNPGKNEKSGQPYVEPKKLAWFSNVKFRRAVAYAIDKKSIIDIVMNGLGYPQDSAMSPSSGFFYTSRVKTYNYDLVKARQLLKEAGFSDKNKDGYIEDARGNTVEFNMFTNSGNTVRVAISEIIRKDLEAIGLKVHFTQLEFNNLVKKMDSTYDWDAIVLGLTGGIEPHFGNNVWQSSGHLHMWYPRQPKPATKWEARIDEIYNLGVQEMDRSRRKVLYDEWQRIVAEQVPFIYTVIPANIFAVRNKFGNLHPTSYGGAFHNLEDIYVK
jgi:peptide/nickel transport system substrate-binding protein